MMMYAPGDMPPFPSVREWYLVRDTLKAMPPRNGLDGHTPGEIRYGIFDSQRICFTSEDSDNRLEDGNGKPYGRSAIPTGRYKLRLPVTGKNILLEDVPGFFHVEICAESGISRDEGDITVGDARTLDGCGDRQPALIRLVTELRRLTRAGIACYLNVGRSE
jgi:hypothetical protein